MKNNRLSLVYSCSGCSSAAQTANMIAIKLDREKIAEMSCIAGVGGDVKPLVKLAKSGREIIAIDGCALACCKSCLAKHEVLPTHHFNLSDFAVAKIVGEDPDLDQFASVYEQVLEKITH